LKKFSIKYDNYCIRYFAKIVLKKFDIFCQEILMSHSHVYADVAYVAGHNWAMDQMRHASRQRPFVPATFDNLTERTTTSLSNSLHRRVVSGAWNFAMTHIAARIAHLLLAPASIFPCTIDTIAGLSAGAASLVTFGLISPCVNFAANELHAIGGLISNPFANLLRTINPHAEFIPTRVRGDSAISRAISEIPLAETISETADRNAHSASFFKRHVLSRAFYAMTAVTAIVSRTALAILAAPAVVLAALTLGTDRNINSFASTALRAPALVSDLIMCGIKIINPRAGEPTVGADQN
jgi:hypothetical protein